MTFEELLEALDKLFIEKFGVGHETFDDYNWDDEFDSEVPPDDAFEEWCLHTEDGTRSPGV